MSGGLSAHVSPPRKPLGQLLSEGGFVSEEQLAHALRDGARTGERLGEVVVRYGWATEDDIAKLLAEQWQLGYVERSSIWFDVDALARMSREQAQRLEALPTRVQDGRVVVAVAEPTEERLAALREVIGDDTVVVVVPKAALDAGVRSELLDTEEPETDVPQQLEQPRPQPAPQQYEQARPQPVAQPRPHAQPQPQRPVVPPLRPLAHPPAAIASPGASADAELVEVLRGIEAAAAEANALQHRIAELTRRLERLSIGLSSVTEQLGGAPFAAPE